MQNAEYRIRFLSSADAANPKGQLGRFFVRFYDIADFSAVFGSEKHMM